MKKSVGLVAVVKTKTGLKVPLQRRGPNDSFPGAMQVICHGKLEEGEDFYDGLIRESCEELGETFTRTCQEDIELTELVHEKTDDKEIVTYGAVIPEDRLILIKLEETSGGIVMIESRNFLQGQVVEITPDKKKDGYPPSVIAMFADEIKAVRKAIAVFG